MRRVLVVLAAVLPALTLVAASGQVAPPMPKAGSDAAVDRAARALHAAAIVVDTHADTPQRMLFEDFDLAIRHDDGHLDIPRMREGGLDAVFFSIWTPGSVTGPAAIKRALDQIDAVREAIRRNPETLVAATTAADIRRAHAAGRIAVLMGIEGGHQIDDDLGVLRLFAALGVRYLTLTHSAPTNWADSSGAPPRHGGLTDFGRKVVRELNRLGVIVDVSHVSDQAFKDVLETSAAPVIASHSSMRALSNHPRNMTDQMAAALAAKGGVVQINFDTEFLSQAMRDAIRAHAAEIAEARKAVAAACGDKAGCSTREMERRVRALSEAGVLPDVTADAIVQHIDHAVKAAGIDNVGLGSDFDGAFMPSGLDDASRLPAITAALRKRGYADASIRKILGGNTLRLMEQVEAVAGKLSAQRGGGRAP